VAPPAKTKAKAKTEVVAKKKETMKKEKVEGIVAELPIEILTLSEILWTELLTSLAERGRRCQNRTSSIADLRTLQQHFIGEVWGLFLGWGVFVSSFRSLPLVYVERSECAFGFFRIVWKFAIDAFNGIRTDAEFVFLFCRWFLPDCFSQDFVLNSALLCAILCLVVLTHEVSEPLVVDGYIGVNHRFTSC